MRGTLWTKLALSYLAVAVLAVGLAAFLFNSALSREFQAYVEEAQRLRDDQIAILLGSIYERDGRWNPRRIRDVLGLGMMSGREIVVLDSEGRRVADCWDSMRGMGQDAQSRMKRMAMICGWGWNQGRRVQEGSPSRAPSPGVPGPPAAREGKRTIPVLAGGRRVGTALIGPTGGEGIFSMQDRSFRATVNRWLWGVVFVSGGIALLMSLGMARRLSRPIHGLTEAARRLREGDLSQRVKPVGRDEISQLAGAFNHLAESLERQEEFRKRLTGELAHELRTPLANLQTHIEALLDGVLAPTSENLNSVHEEILRLGRLVGSLEELTRAEASSLTLKRKETDLGVLVERITGQFDPLFLEKGVRLTRSLPDSSLCACLDGDKISQVIGNLLSNALKFTPRGGRVEVALEEQGGEVRILVRDTGVGIPEKDIPFIFERFFRGKNGGDRAARGSGIGLTIARELAQVHGGRIEVKSHPNRGTEFTVRLPLCPQDKKKSLGVPRGGQPRE
ncbi:MAG: HAMP domain-containing protein [Deltaproteobacteria bacterium]|nr:HAMP domain-containing protein [Deltaproteobacteria bacterium]